MPSRSWQEILDGFRQRWAEKPHSYRVWVCDTGDFETADRHYALQHYMAARKRLKDFSGNPAEYKVRMFCDGVEYFNDPSPDWGKSEVGLSIRNVAGTPKRPIGIRVMP